MASEADHISLADRNHDFLVDVLREGRFPDWAATVAFYKAVHVVEAVFAADLGRDSTSHTDREESLKTLKLQADIQGLHPSADRFPNREIPGISR